METSHEIVLGCFAKAEDTAEVKFDWFVTQYAADNELEYFFVESIRRLPAAFGNLVAAHKREETQQVLNDIEDEIFTAMDSGDTAASSELSKVYLLLNDVQFNHRTAIYYNVDDDDMAIPSAEDRDLFYVRGVVFQ